MRLVPALALAGAALFLPAGPAGALEVSPTCPSGSQGVVVSHGGSTTYVCTTAVRDVQQVISYIADVDCDCSIDLPPK